MSTIKLLPQYKQNLLKKSEIYQEKWASEFDQSKNRRDYKGPGLQAVSLHFLTDSDNSEARGNKNMQTTFTQ